MGRSLNHSTNWIRFPFYHHVFQDEQQNFARHLGYLRDYGDFISVDDALSLLSDDGKINGRYFCLSLDDGLKSCYNGAMPILSELNIPAVFYVVTKMVGRSLEADDPIARNVFGFKGRNRTLDFLSWDNCLEMISANMTIGSHTTTHTRLSDLTDDQTRAEMENSKTEIEQNTGQPCRHFCPPYGIPNTDYDAVVDVELAKSSGYKTFATGIRGPNRQGDSPFALKRDHLLAGWENFQLRYFLSLD